MRETFQTLLEAFLEFKREHNTGYVPVSTVSHLRGREIRLGTWAANVRYRARKGALSPEHKATLSQYGFVWESDNKADEQRKANMKALRDSGATLQSIADAYGITRQRVHQIIG